MDAVNPSMLRYNIGSPPRPGSGHDLYQRSSPRSCPRVRGPTASGVRIELSQRSDQFARELRTFLAGREPTGAAVIARGPIAQAARYDSRRGLVVISLEGGCEFAFPAALAEGLADEPRSKLAKIKVSPNGLGLHWPLLDADLYVPGLIEGAFGTGRWMQQIGKLGGLSRSASKAKASRENGKRGGRPKDRAAA